MRIGIYGGTFNPPHIGHMRAAAHAIEILELDRLVLIPNNVAPHKKVTAGASGQQRLEMLRLSARGMKKAEVSSIELDREGTSYTADTLDQLRRAHPGDELVLMMGTDMFLSFLSWYEPERIMQNATLAVFYRGEKNEQLAVEAQKDKLEAMGAKVVLVANPVTAISSTDLRRMLVFRCADPFLCPGVSEYIRERGLYGTGRDYRKLSMEALEEAVLSLLKPNRVAHVLGCRDAAVELARRYGADLTDAARAGLLHDITKAIDGPLQLTLCDEYGILLNKFSQENPKTLHALTGSLVAEQIFGENEAVVTAIRYHTTGRPDMGLLEKIIYIADYIEANRDFPGVEEMRKAAYEDLDVALLMGLESAMAHVRRQGQELAAATADAVKFLRDRGVKTPEEM
ncbi:MAG: nicotinate (nicotinamide) nucleotide adenylyltransferase [Oscillospiraceae bacterium]|nr:nicotinate (nicotinamide) nucleotide adenylyltransferase [Oscillospiraceae bacterium]